MGRGPADPDWKRRLADLRPQAPAARGRPGAPPPLPPKEPPERVAQPPVTDAELPDDDLFAREVEDVRPLEGDAVADPDTFEPAITPRPASRPHDDVAVMGELARLVRGEEPFRFREGDEIVEASVPSLDPRVLKRLRRGEFVIDARLDLHGYNTADARLLMDRFIEEGVRQGRRVVLVVHGRGLHSEQRVPVIKERLKGWLTRSGLARHVLAFVSARPGDGGVGALYVLLRRDRSANEKPHLLRS